MEIQLVRTETQAEHVRILAWEFVDWVNGRYPEMQEEILQYMANQKFEEQISDVRRYYSPPEGECLLAMKGDFPLGIVMLKKNSEKVCEMNRMFVRAEARGMGVAKALCDQLVLRAQDLGYTSMFLVALDNHTEAIALYTSLGFVRENRSPDMVADNPRQVEMLMQL